MLSVEHLPRFGLSLVILVAALALGAWLCRRNALRDPVDRLLCFLCPSLTCVVLTWCAIGILKSPSSDWNADRLAPAVSLLHGYKLYYGPSHGPVLNTIYTPMSSVVFMPAGLTSSPTLAILTAVVIGFLLFFLPILLLCSSAQGAGKNRSPLLGIYLLVSACHLTLRGGLGVAFTVHADSPALGFAGLACMVVYLKRGLPDPSIGTWTLAALFATLSVWSKQTLAPIVLVLPLWAFLAHGPRAAARSCGATAIVLTAATILFRQIFGKGSFLFNTIRLPKLHPWVYVKPDTFKGFLLLILELGTYCLPMILLGLIALYLRRRLPSKPRAESTDEQPSPRPWRTWFQDNPWSLFALTALATAPLAVLGRIKVGGAPNNYAPPLYFLAMAICAILLEWHERNRERELLGLNRGIKVALLTSFLSPLTLMNDQLIREIDSIGPVLANQQELAYQYSKKNPEQVYYPWNTLSTLMAEGRLYHFEYGLLDRELAGYPVSDAHFRSFVPSKLRQVCFPPNRQGEWTMKYLKEFTRRVDIKELPGWICYERQ